MKNKYHGWANYTTWNIDLWATSCDEKTYRHVEDNKPYTPAKAKRVARQLFGNATPDGAKLSAKCVDWKEIADAWNE
jgi:hypothetical protein